MVHAAGRNVPDMRQVKLPRAGEACCEAWGSTSKKRLFFDTVATVLVTGPSNEWPKLKEKPFARIISASLKAWEVTCSNVAQPLRLSRMSHLPKSRWQVRARHGTWGWSPVHSYSLMKYEHPGCGRTVLRHRMQHQAAQTPLNGGKVSQI